MKLPRSWLKDYIALPETLSLDDLVAAFIKIGFEVESVKNVGDEISGPIKIGRVISIEELEGLKKPIRYVTLDIGESDLVSVICGARNFQEGDLVVVALPGAVLPGNFNISARETYGRKSNGMICSARELAMGEDHSGIIVLTQGVEGADALNALGLDDPIIEIAVNPDRGYAMSVRGAARELAMALDLEFKDFSRFEILSELEKKKVSGEVRKVEISDPSGASAIYLRTLTDIDPHAATPLWIRNRLLQAGMRSISLPVDITNYIMLDMGQPLHAFDSDKVTGVLRVTRSSTFQEIKTLDGELRKLGESDLLIADDLKPLALAGTMGGSESEVSGETKNILLEAASFDSTAIAGNSRSHRLSSEASRRFERGVDPDLAEVASAQAALFLIEYSGAKYLGFSSQQHPLPAVQLSFSPRKISQVLGTQFSDAEIERALTAIGGEVVPGSEEWVFVAPSWRRDITHVADLSEEVGRYYGYERIPSILPVVKFSPSLPPGPSRLQKRRKSISLLLAHRGLIEVQSYPFINQEQLDSMGFTGDRAKTFRLANPMSDQYPLLRTHLIPGLLSTVTRNLTRGKKSIAIFETGAVFRNLSATVPAVEIAADRRPSPSEIKKIYESVPHQPLHVAGVLAGEFDIAGWWGGGRGADWLDAISIANEIIESTGHRSVRSNVDLAPWHPGRCAEFSIDGRVVAHAGEIHPRIITAFNLPERTSAFTVIVDAIPFAHPVVANAINTMPAAIQDISLYLPSNISASSVEEALREGAGPLLEEVALFDRYQKEGEDWISLAFTLIFRDPERTLTAEEVSRLRSNAGEIVAQKFGAVIRQ
jgi:phenylalanyl-tRNA synthetase beta chain